MVNLLSRLRNSCFAIACLLPGLLGEVVLPKPAAGAEEVQVVVGGPLKLSVSVDALARFAETGETTGDLALIVGFVNVPTRESIRQTLARPIPLDLVTVDSLAYSPLGRDVISNVGEVIRLHPEINGFHALRAAVIGAAAAAGPEGWTMLDALRQFPSESINVNLQDLLALRRELRVYFDYNQAVVAAVQQQADAEASQTSVDPSRLPDLSQSGPHTVAKTSLIVEALPVRQAVAGFTVNYDFPVDLYYPQDLGEPAPVAIISHGFGDVKESFTFMAEHLASHGIATLIPDHVGSDLSYRQAFFEGRLNTLLSPMEFLNRPQEISVLIDELERLTSRSPEWAARLDLERIGVMGDSMGGSTALSVAGAELNYGRLTAACDRDNVILNFTLYLECRARFLPPRNYQLGDERVKAVVAMHPMGGYLYGPEGMGQIDIPLLMISGSDDIVAPVVTEQIYPFVWAQASPKYLALLQVGTHFTSKPGRNQAEGIFRLLAGAHRDIGTRYAKALVAAFFQTYLKHSPSGGSNDGPSSGSSDASTGETDGSPYLTAAYGRALSADQPLTLDIIQSLTAERIEEIYRRRPPIPINPEAIALPPSPRNESVLAEIQRTGVLKVGFRKDAPPFGYLNQDYEWDGYCGDMAIALSDYLTEALESPVAVELVELTSTLQNRFELVTEGSVHLECGPNIIRPGLEGVTFSQSILTASTRFLVPSRSVATINPNLPLDNVRLGVLENTAAETLVQNSYPRATIVPFAAPDGRQAAVAAVASGQIDAFVGEDVLSYAELLQNGRDANDFALVPELPLSCEFYGLILPNNDADWRATVNQFLASEDEDAVFADWFETAFSFSLEATDYCLNQR